MTELDRKLEEYNSIPVYYCKDCLSLKIISLGGDECFCDKCGCTDIAETDIFTWEKLYQEKYNHKFIEDGRKSYYVWADSTRED